MGNADALRALLDQLGPHALRYRRGGAAGITLSDRRFGAGVLAPSGVAASLYAQDAPLPALPAAILRRWLPGAPNNWAGWWSSRRALLHWDGASFQFVELE